MSRVISAVIIAVFLTVISIISAGYSSEFSDDITSRVDKLCNGEGDIEELHAKWSEYNETAALYFDHEELEKVTALVGRISENESDSDLMFRMDCNEIRLIMEHLRESQMLKIKNIL